MSRKGENLKSRIAKIPMAMVVVPFAVGIFFVDAIQVPVWLLIVACAVSITGAIALKKWLHISNNRIVPLKCRLFLNLGT